MRRLGNRSSIPYAEQAMRLGEGHLRMVARNALQALG
jgi:hypothetical protein